MTDAPTTGARCAGSLVEEEGQMRDVTLAGRVGQAEGGAVAHRWSSWWANRGETLELFFYTLLVPVDFLAVFAAFLAASGVHTSTGGSGPSLPSATFVAAFVLVTPLWVASFGMVGLYSEEGVRGRWSEIRKVFVAASGPAMLLAAVDSLRHGTVFGSTDLPVFGYLFSLAFVVAGRQLVHGMQNALFARNLGVHRALVIGSGPVAQHIVRTLTMTRRSAYRVVGVIDDGERHEGSVLSTLPVFTTVHEAAETLEGRFDEIIHADSSLPRDDILEIMRYANDKNLSYRFVPSQSGLYPPNTVVGTLAGVAVVEIRQTPLEGWGRIIKRCFDVVGAAVGLVVLAPVLAAVAAVVALSDPGPVLFSQERLGRNGRPFRIWKFRTMAGKYSGRPALEVFAELGREDLVTEFLVEQKVKDDPRVTRTGAFLRTTSLDELPQLWNVLRGELSLVGPRPIVRDELTRFGAFTGTILALKPGITGLWQTSGRNDIGYEERVKLNIEYVESWSLRLDVVILLRTVLVVLRGGGGAY
jgi:exopolysaccharide biosynthesis polyprenyl glycosylphosphotransferase